jgi:hypothetical protein
VGPASLSVLGKLNNQISIFQFFEERSSGLSSPFTTLTITKPIWTTLVLRPTGLSVPSISIPMNFRF